mmetsp:Transcript_8911/g.24694  ORF Transcript_8911/g.24694 Transcript_8911/m.24694 type:complete len:99 (-) Transcript_8911:404-700(-)
MDDALAGVPGMELKEAFEPKKADGSKKDDGPNRMDRLKEMKTALPSGMFTKIRKLVRVRNDLQHEGCVYVLDDDTKKQINEIAKEALGVICPYWKFQD